MLAARDNIKDRLLFKLMADQCQSEVFVTRLCKMPKRVSCRKGYRRINYIDTDEIPGLLLLLKIISSPRAANISFLLVVLVRFFMQMYQNRKFDLISQSGWIITTQKFGFINGVDNVNWPPYRDSKR